PVHGLRNNVARRESGSPLADLAGELARKRGMRPMSTERDARIDAAIAEYLAACDAGTPPERAAFLARYPELADSLSEFLDDHARMRGAAPPGPDTDATLPPAPTQPPDTGDTATLPTSPGKPSPNPHDRVRYFGDYELLSEIARGGMGVVF